MTGGMTMWLIAYYIGLMIGVFIGYGMSKNDRNGGGAA